MSVVDRKNMLVSEELTRIECVETKDWMAVQTCKLCERQEQLVPPWRDVVAEGLDIQGASFANLVPYSLYLG